MNETESLGPNDLPDGQRSSAFQSDTPWRFDADCEVIPVETWRHYDEFRGAWYDIPPLSPGRKRSIADSAGVQFRSPDTDETTCPGEDHHIYPTSPGGCKVVDHQGIPRLICSNSGCETHCAGKNECMQEIRYEEIRAARSTAPYEEPSMAQLVAMGYDGPGVSLKDFLEGTEGRGPCVGAVLLKWKALKEKLQQLVDRATKEASGREKRRVRWGDKRLFYRKPKVLPPGEYEVEIVKVRQTRSRKTGNEMLVLSNTASTTRQN